MNEQRAIRSVNYPRGLYFYLRDKAESEDQTNREQIKKAVEAHLDVIEKLLIDVGLAQHEDERHLVRVSVDKAIDAKLEGVAKRLGIDYSAILLACLRRQYDLRIGEEEAEKLQWKIKRARKKSAKD